MKLTSMSLDEMKRDAAMLPDSGAARYFVRTSLRNAINAAEPEQLAAILELFIAAEEKRVQSPWRDFASAPQDGRHILAWRSDAGVFVARYPLVDDPEDWDSDVWFTSEGEDLTGNLPTLWMPFPEPPTAAEAEED